LSNSDLVIVGEELLTVLALFGPHRRFPFPAPLAVLLQPFRVLSAQKDHSIRYYYLKFRVNGNMGVMDGVCGSVIRLFGEYQIRIQILIQIRIHTHIFIKRQVFLFRTI